MKSEILRLLKSSDTYLSGQQICEQFQVSRTAVWKVMEQLKKEGYQIEAVRNKGYRLVDSPDVMSKAEIESLISTKWAGRHVVYYDETDSTNTRAKETGGKRGQNTGLWSLPTGRMQARGAEADLGSAGRNQHLYDHFAPP